VAGCETLQINISFHIEKRSIPLTLETLGIRVLFLLECKKWAWHLQDTALNNNLLKLNQMPDFNKVNAMTHKIAEYLNILKIKIEFLSPHGFSLPIKETVPIAWPEFETNKTACALQQS
jgi:hypothetical protein